MQNFSETKVTIIVAATPKQPISVFQPIECAVFTPFVTAECPQNVLLQCHTRNKSETSTKHVRNVALYNPRALSDANLLECLTYELTLLMHRQHSIDTMNLVTLYFRLTLLLVNMQHVTSLCYFRKYYYYVTHYGLLNDNSN